MNHYNPIISFDMNVKGTIVVTGEQCNEPVINIWDAHTGLLINTLKPVHEYGVVLVKISPDCTTIVSVGNDINHTIVVWNSYNGDWIDYRIEAVLAGNRLNPHFISFLPKLSKHLFSIGGDRYITFYSIKGKSIISVDGNFNNVNGRKQQINTGTIFNNNLVTGTQCGSIYVWDLQENILHKSIQAHDKSITAMYSTKTRDNEVLLTGCIIGMILVWNTSFNNIKSININDMNDRPLSYAISSLCINYDGTILIGCKSGEIYEMTYFDNDLLIHRGHCVEELWGLDMNQKNPDEFVTSGDDCTIRIWSLSQHTMKQLVLVDTKSRAVRYSPSLEYIIVGLGGSIIGKSKKEGSYLILESDSLLIKHEGRDTREWITDIKTNKNGDIIALCSNDNRIYMYISIIYLDMNQIHIIF